MADVSRTRSDAPRPVAPAWRDALLVLVALAFRLPHLGAGLPEFRDEAIPFRRALAMASGPGGAIDWNPHFFHYPSLTIYAHLLLQRAQILFAGPHGAADFALGVETDPTRAVLVARALGVAWDLVLILAAARVADRLRPRAGLLAGLLLAGSTLLIATTRGVYVDAACAAFAVLALERALAWHSEGGRARLATAAACVGLAAGAKYPGAAMLLPLAWVIASREGRRALPAMLACGAIAAAVFVVTTPYALLDAAAFRTDFAFLSHMGAEGNLGSSGGSGFGFLAGWLAKEIGPVAVGLLALSVVGAAIARFAGPLRATARTGVIAAWLALLVFFVPVAVARVESARYVVPLLPFAASLAAGAALGLAERAPARLRAVAPFALGLAMLASPIAHGSQLAATAGDDTRGAAARWLAAHATRDDVILQESYAAPVLDRLHALDVRGGAAYGAASAPARAAFDARRTLSSVVIPITVVGHVTVPVPDGRGGATPVTVTERGSDLNAAVYDPRLLAGIDYVVTSSAVRARLAARPDENPVPARFYALLDSTATLAARFSPATALGDPEVRVYRLTPRTAAALAALGPLPAEWWTGVASPAFRAEVAARLGTREAPPELVARLLAPVYDARFASFVNALAYELLDHGRFAPARDLARAAVQAAPGDVSMALTYATAAESLGAWSEARQALERTIGALGGIERVPAVVQWSYADALARDGAPERARPVFEQLARGADAELAALARARLAPPAR